MNNIYEYHLINKQPLTTEWKELDRELVPSKPSKAHHSKFALLFFSETMAYLQDGNLYFSKHTYYLSWN